MSELVVTKKCCRCKKFKEVSKFCKSSRYTSGYRSECKTCKKISDKKYYRRHKGQQKQYQQHYRKSSTGKTIHYLQTQRYNYRYPDKAKAHRVTNNAVRYGKLPKPGEQICKRCKKRKAQQYHHPDYSKPLDVIPLCRRCHKSIHSLSC